MVTKQKALGQFFTPEHIVEFMCDLSTNKQINSILEPSAGEGIFLKSLEKRYNPEIIDSYEIDETLKNESSIEITNADFLTTQIDKRYDLIIGNPPYVRWKNIPDYLKENLLNDERWNDTINGLFDLLYPFIIKCVELLNENGELIFITPSFWLQTQHALAVREEMLNHGNLEILINFNESKVFPKVSSNIVIFKFVKTTESKEIKVIDFKTKDKIDSESLDEINEFLKDCSEEYCESERIMFFKVLPFENSNPWKPIPQHIESKLNKIENSCEVHSPTVEVNGKEYKLSSLLTKDDLNQFGLNAKDLKKVRYNNKNYFVSKPQQTLFGSTGNYSRPVRLEDLVEIGNGMVSGLDSAFKVEDDSDLNDMEIIVAKAANLNQYFNDDITKYIFANDIEDLETLKSDYSLIYNHLLPFKDKLDERYKYNKDIPFWHWVFLRNKDLMESSEEKIFVPCKERVDKRGYIRFAFVEGKVYATQDVTAMVRKDDVKEDMKYILALLNSKLLYEWIIYKGLKRGGVLEFSEKPLSKIPIRLIDWNNEKEVKIYNNIVDLINQLLSKKERDMEIINELEENIEELYLQ